MTKLHIITVEFDGEKRGPHPRAKYAFKTDEEMKNFKKQARGAGWRTLRMGEAEPTTVAKAVADLQAHPFVMQG